MQPQNNDTKNAKNTTKPTKTKSVLNVLTKQIYESRYSATNPYEDEPYNQWTKCTQKRKKALLSTLSYKQDLRKILAIFFSYD